MRAVCLLVTSSVALLLDDSDWFRFNGGQHARKQLGWTENVDENKAG
jgi:hypothetical protein